MNRQLCLETAARALKIVLIPAPVHSDAEIETALIALGASREAALSSSLMHSWHASRADYIGGGPEQRTGGLYAI
jgi:hypothetical protein